jgi:hypothetical protein
MHLRSLRLLSPSSPARPATSHPLARPIPQHHRRLPSAAKQNARLYDGGDLSIETQVQNALNLALVLKSRAQMPALLATINAAKDDIHAALTGLHYVHFARFLPTPDFSALQVVTSYDGDLESYLMDFVVVLGDAFNAILAFVQDAPPLPVQRFPREFVAFVDANNIPAPVWTAYPHVTVIDVLEAPLTVR